MKTPRITHLQAVVLSLLIGTEDLFGRELRQRIEKTINQRKSLAAFYQMMARLEDAGLVEGRYHEKKVDGIAITERVYRITGEGKLQLTSLAAFYEGVLPNAI